MIALALKALGLMRVSEHEEALKADAIQRGDLRRMRMERDDWEAKFKRAATDLAAQAEEIELLRNEIAMQGASLTRLQRRADDNERDANMWRDYLKRSRDRKAGKK